MSIGWVYVHIYKKGKYKSHGLQFKNANVKTGAYMTDTVFNNDGISAVLVEY